MQITKILASKTIVFNLIISLTLTYLFLAFLPTIHLINPGLDASWSYGISQAAKEKLVFGKEIVFTYGPLGYLTQGAALYSNFKQIILFRFAVHFVLLGLLILRIIKLQTNSLKILILINFIFIFVLGIHYGNTIGFTTDYQIFSIFLLALSFEKFFIKYLPVNSIIVGMFTGLAILTKLTLGIYIAGTFYLFLFSGFYLAYRKQKLKNLSKYIQSLFNFTLIAISVASIFLYSGQSITVLTKLLVNFIISGIVAFVIDKILSKTRLTTFFKKLLPYLVFYLFYTTLLIQSFSSNNFPSLSEYILNSWQISSGYSSTMSLTGSKRAFISLIRDINVLLATLCCAVIINLLFRLCNSGSTSLSIALLFPLFLGFKHGFVRQDFHVVLFCIIVLLIISLYFIKIDNNPVKNKPKLYIIYLILLLSCIAISTLRNYQFSKLNPAKVANNINIVVLLLDNNKFQAEVQRITSENLVKLNNRLKLPDSVLEKVQGKTIDIIPWEFSLIPGNQLNWKPRPIIQSYSAYTEKLDELNYQSLSQSPRDYLIYHFQSIDDRHPFFDEPKAFSYVVCNYQLDSVNSPFRVPAIKTNFYLLEKQKVSGCIPTPLGETTNITWDQVYELPTRNSGITRVQVKFEYSWLGKIVKQLFRIPPVIINVNYLDGTQANFRFVQDNSANGVILSHLPRNDQELMAFFQGKLPPQVKSFSFSVSNPLLFSPEIKVTPFWEVDAGS
ncbi:MAG: hypothetical protein ACK4YL_24835 [Microcystis sp.]|jgi:hypothetical protein|uniref:hypothetical protein n=1 Tax=Microcystis TaxID=1125 RepID=UPI0016804AD6|nr:MULTISPECIES: hypothetical protein [Microcystis]MBD2289423.1 hypothetical protein [Microcystis wesenbergii FACHB-1317]UZO75507.1 hypothetical protein M8120_22540 [Microcystis aeruginosa str. Chao 1910]